MTAPGTAVARHGAREAAVQMLYQWEVGGHDIAEVLATYPSMQARRLDESQRAFAEALVRGTAVSLDRIDPLIARQAQHWRIERMSVIDRLILRLAIFEMLTTETARPVIIDEALELVRTFSTEAAVKFVNGVLDGVSASTPRTGPYPNPSPDDHVP